MIPASLLPRHIRSNILSNMRLTNTYSPWKHAAQYPWLHIETRVELPNGTSGLIGSGIIWICRTLQQAQRRCVLAHELVHLERGHACNNDKEETVVDRIAAHRLINDADLRRALQWTGGRINHECAEELWVDLHTLIHRAQTTSWIPQDCIPALDYKAYKYVGV